MGADGFVPGSWDGIGWKRVRHLEGCVGGEIDSVMGATIRIGHGWDLHRLEPVAPHGPGRDLVVGGIRLEHDRGPVSHSDGDALLHAITDAILGALGKPDIGQMFPDHEAENENRDSMEFLREAARLAREAGFEIGNLDATVALERPKIAGVKERMRVRIAEGLGVERSRVNLKGKTGESVGIVGEGRAVEAWAVVLLVSTEQASV